MPASPARLRQLPDGDGCEGAGYRLAASELERAGQAYAAGIDNRPLMARRRLASVQTAYLYGRPRQATAAHRKPRDGRADRGVLPRQRRG
jgi:hypothetical protein